MDSNLHIEIIGLLKDQRFHEARCIAEGLKEKFDAAFMEPTVQPLFECDWYSFLSSKKMELRGEVWQYSSSLMCFLNGHLLGSEMDLASWAESQWGFTFTQPQAFYTELTENYYLKHIKKTGHEFVFMDIEIAGKAVGRLMFEVKQLFSDVCPKTSENFKALCTGDQGLALSGYPLSYKGSVFHRVVPNGWVQGGDISPERRGDGGESIYGPTFEDESFAVSHTKRGTLGMANKGPHSNGSQFYITLQPTLWMDKTYVAFGQVVEGVDVLRTLEEVPTYNERPRDECKVVDCGIVDCSSSDFCPEVPNSL